MSGFAPSGHSGSGVEQASAAKAQAQSTAVLSRAGTNAMPGSLGAAAAIPDRDLSFVQPPTNLLPGSMQFEAFPFPGGPYPTQLALMRAVYASCASGLVALLESPTGTGKTLSLLCAAIQWLRDHRLATLAAEDRGSAAERVESPAEAASASWPWGADTDSLALGRSLGQRTTSIAAEEEKARLRAAAAAEGGAEVKGPTEASGTAAAEPSTAAAADSGDPDWLFESASEAAQQRRAARAALAARIRTFLRAATVESGASGLGAGVGTAGTGGGRGGRFGAGSKRGREEGPGGESGDGADGAAVLDSDETLELRRQREEMEGVRGVMREECGVVSAFTSCSDLY